MKDLFVPYELGLKLKEKGFDAECLAYYHKDIELVMFSEVPPFMRNNRHNSNVCAPLWQQAIDLLREEKGVLLTVDKWMNEEKNWCYAITKFNETNLAEYKEQFDSYYSALQSGIEKALELI
jgi:hypothetical protein